MIRCYCDFNIDFPYGGKYCKATDNNAFLLWKDNREVMCYDEDIFYIVAKIIENIVKFWMIVEYHVMYILTLTLFLFAVCAVLCITENTFNKNAVTKTPLFKTISIVSQTSCFIYCIQWSYDYAVTKTQPDEFLTFLPMYVLSITSGVTVSFACIIWIICKFPLCFIDCCTQPNEECCPTQPIAQQVVLAAPLIANEVSNEVTQQPPKIAETLSGIGLIFF